MARVDDEARGRARAWGIVRVVVTLVMLAVLLPRATRLLDPLWKPSTVLWLAGAIAVTLVGVVLATLRWHRVLVALEVRTTVRPLVSNYLAGLFVSNFLPTTIGGDVLRVARLSRMTGERPRSFASVVLERLTGWVVLPVISLFALLVNPGLLRPPSDDASRIVIVISLLTLTGLSLILFGASSPAVGRRLESKDGWLRFLNAVHLGLARFRRSPAAALEVLVVGFAYQLAVVAAAFLAAKALGLPIGWTAILAFMPAVAIVQVLPFPTIGGLGVREGAFVLFLHPLGVSTDEAITLGLIVYGINLFASLLGAPAFAVGGRDERATATA
ncbi:MAG TPA: lysylphosphatidylglycerol synthase transmembrane domain-containing protein [Acidimicrobiales bacterium]|nr:lysylphosphatidylglycerol synthase transmembrane domain-containing protein [Acidimicrobiales bacterium]